MTHARNTIRSAMVTQLTGLPLTGSNVFPPRAKPIQDSDLPAIVVNTLSEEHDVDQASFASGVLKQMRALQVQVVVHSRNIDGETVAAQLDSIAEDVEDIIYADKTLGVSVKDTMYQGTEIVIEPDSDIPRGEMTLTFLVMYRVSESATGTIIG